MENSWLKDKVRAELEVEYKKKLDDVVAYYEKKSLDGFEEAWRVVEEQKARYEKERDKYAEIETKLYAGVNLGDLE